MYCDLLSKLPHDFYKNISTAKTLVIAVSGGSDSLALLHFLYHYKKYNFLPCSLKALTIDHQLRKESYKEALFVENFCKERNIPHKILKWQNKKPKTGILHNARLARYGLLIKEISNYEDPMLLTAHTFTDQVETYIMRKNKAKDSTRGLSAMPFLSYLKDSFKLYKFYRPFLNIPRETLQNYLKKENLSWVHDPSNDNENYERIFIRKNLDSSMIENYQILIKNAQENRIKQSERSNQLLSALSPIFAYNCLSFQYPASMKEDPDFSFLFNLLSSLVGGVSYNQGKKGYSFIKNYFLDSKESRICKTLNRTIIEQSSKNFENFQVKIWRENRHFKTLEIEPFKKKLWDNRFFIKNHTKDSLFIQPMDKNIFQKFLSNHFETNEISSFYKKALQDSFSIHLKDEIIIPFFSRNSNLKKEFSLSYNLSLFHWLIPSYEFDLYKNLEKIFKI